MKCPQCQFTVSNKKDVCGRCYCDLRPKKKETGLPIFNPKTPIETLIEMERRESHHVAPQQHPPVQTTESTGASSREKTMPAWLLRLFFTKKTKPVQQQSMPEADVGSHAEPTPLNVSPIANIPTQPISQPKPVIKSSSTQPIVTKNSDNDNLFHDSLLSTQFTDDVRKVLHDTFDDSEDDKKLQKDLDNALSIEQLMRELEEITAAPEQMSGMASVSSHSPTPATPTDLGIEALIAELDQATAAEDESNEELNRLFELALSLEEKVGEATQSTAALAAHPFPEAVKEFDSTNAKRSPAMDFAGDMVVDLEKVEPNDLSALEPLVADDIWATLAQPPAPESVPASPIHDEQVHYESPESPPLFQELLTLLSEAYGVDPNVILGLEPVTTKTVEAVVAVEPEPVFDPLSSLTSELDQELELLKNEGTTFLTAATSAEPEVEKATEEEVVVTPPVVTVNPLQELEGELDRELDALSSEGTSFARVDSNFQEEILSPTETPSSVEPAEPVHDFSEELAILAQEADMLATVDTQPIAGAVEVEEKVAEQEPEQEERIVVSSSDSEHEIRKAHVEETQVIDNSELMRIVAEIEQQYETQQKQNFAVPQITPKVKLTEEENEPETADEEISYETVSPFTRIRAAVVDGVVSVGLGALVSLMFILPSTRAAFLSFTIPPLHMLGPDLIKIIASIFAAWVASSWVLNAQGMQTVGSKMCGFAVVDMDGFPLSFSQALLRALCQVTTILSGGLGFFMVWGKKHRTLHDWLSQSQVIREIPLAEPEAEVLRKKVYEIAA